MEAIAKNDSYPTLFAYSIGGTFSKHRPYIAGLPLLGLILENVEIEVDLVLDLHGSSANRYRLNAELRLFEFG